MPDLIELYPDPIKGGWLAWRVGYTRLATASGWRMPSISREAMRACEQITFTAGAAEIAER